MKLKVTVNIFSGRENPSFILEGEEASQLADKLKFGASLTSKGSTAETGPSLLGFSGFTIQQLDAKPAKSIPSTLSIHGNLAVTESKIMRVDAAGDVEDLLVKKAADTPVGKSIEKFPSFLREQIRASRDPLKKWEQRVIDPGIIPVLTAVTPCTCGPLYEPAWWNDGGQKQFNNNCYNYASNYRSDTFAQPGRATGAMYTQLSGCNVPSGQRSAKMGAVSDCLIDTPLANNNCPQNGHLVALVIWPNVDFHWYRKDASGWWSHKPGGTQVTNKDNSGNAIADPRTANRGGYTEFCTFMNVMHGHIKLQ